MADNEKENIVETEGKSVDEIVNEVMNDIPDAPEVHDEELDELIDKDEYEKALQKLNSSKSSRVKEINEKKAQEKAEAKEKKEEELPEAKSFVEKIKRDPVIPICILLALLSLIGACFYFILPSIMYRSMGMTLDELRDAQKESTIFKDHLEEFGFTIPAEFYFTPAEEVNGRENVSYFYGIVANSVTPFGTAMKGSSRNSDGELMSFTVYAEYSDDRNYFNFLGVWFATFFQGLYPGLSDHDAVDLATSALGSIGGDDAPFTVRGNIAYRVILEKDETGMAIVELQFIPAAEAISKDIVASEVPAVQSAEQTEASVA